MALEPGSEQRDLTVSEDTSVGHPQERPEEWGWHGEWGGAARVGGWISAIILVLMMTSTHYNGQGVLFLGLSAVGLIVTLMWDRKRRKNSWRQ